MGRADRERRREEGSVRMSDLVTNVYRYLIDKIESVVSTKIFHQKTTWPFSFLSTPLPCSRLRNI